MRPILASLVGTALLGSLFALPAQATTIQKNFYFSPGDACQLSIPTTDTKIRPRANGYRNEGTTSQFVICGLGGYEASTPTDMYLYFTSMDGVAHSMSCTAVTGLTGFDGPYYATKTVNVPASSYGLQVWSAADFGGNDDDPLPVFSFNLSVTCTLPPNVALQGLSIFADIDVGA